MSKKIEYVITRIANWGKIRISLILVFLFSIFGLVFLWSTGLQISLCIVYYWICSEVLKRWNWLLEKITRRGVEITSVVLALFLAGWNVLILISILPDNVNIRFENLFATAHSFSELDESKRSQATIDFIRENLETLPENNTDRDSLEDGIVYDNLKISSPSDIVGNIALVRASAVPKPKRVFVLVHPHNTQFWYVQTPLTYVETTDKKYWEGYVYFGTMDCDCKLKFDLIVLGSKDWYVLDVFRGRGLRAGMKLDYLPTLNQSEVIVVQKHYDGIFDENKCSDKEGNYTTIESTCPVE